MPGRRLRCGELFETRRLFVARSDSCGGVYPGLVVRGAETASNRFGLISLNPSNPSDLVFDKDGSNLRVIKIRSDRKEGGAIRDVVGEQPHFPQAQYRSKYCSLTKMARLVRR